ncbi:MAG TPA: hypothetical protein VFS43_37225 [Polyangiaceae bacterium]|nr:hypothetical protein [Polyangiaceae bacterium]
MPPAHRLVLPVGALLLAVRSASAEPAPASANADPSPARAAGSADSTSGGPDVGPECPPAAGADAAAPGPAGAAGRRPACPERSAWAVGAAIVPGLLVHGAGHYVMGEKRTAGRLLTLEGVGLGAVGGGLVLLAASGASRRLVAPVAAVTIAGVGLFAISTLADLYGVLAPPGGTGAPLTVAPRFGAELGLRYVYDPVFAYRTFTFQALEARLGGLRVAQSGWYSLGEHRNRRLRLEGAYRLYGPLPAGDGERARDGSFVEAEAALTDHDFDSEGFAVTTGEVSLRGRLDLGRLGPTLAGSFAELGVGTALAANRYDRHPDEADSLLLGGFAFGVYLGRRADRWGEAKVYYDHRHDGYAAGLKMTGLGSGVPGHFGARALFFFAPSWGAQAEVQAGSAYVTGLSLLYRYGVSP